jgi:hypothetical protein
MKTLAENTSKMEYDKDVLPENKSHFELLSQIDENAEINENIGRAV